MAEMATASEVTGIDSLSGGSGDVNIGWSTAPIRLMAAVGTDRADFFGLLNGATITLTGSGQGTAVEAVTGAIDTLTGIEQIKGTAHADTITGSNDSSLEVYEGSGGNDTINGQDGSDRVQFYGASQGVYVNLAAGVSKSIADYLNGTSLDASAVGVDSFTNIERINGSSYGDYITAVGFGVTANAANMSTSRNTSNIIWSGGGNDTVEGNGDTELAFNDNGATSGVVVDLQAGTATSAYSGSDVISGGIIGVTGSKHADRIKGANTNRSGESYTGLAGDDTFEGGGGYDVAFYGSIQSSLQIDLAAGTVIGETGVVDTDTLIGIEAITGGAAADTYDASGFGLLASNPNRVDDGGFFNSFEGRGGDDTIIGNGATRIAYSNASAGVGISLIDGLGMDLVDGLALINGADPTTYTFGNLAGVGIDEFSGVNNVRGSAYGDLFIGGNRASDQLEQYEGRGGDDSIYGGTGYDRVNYHLDGIGTTFIVDNGIVQFALDENSTQIYTTGLTINMADGIVIGDPFGHWNG
jgi:hypothetical protein